MGLFDLGIVLVVVLVVLAGGIRFIGSVRGKRDCCSGAKNSGAAVTPRVVVADHNEAHYPYTVDIEIEGMHCEHCVTTVEDALNSLGEVWATVSLVQGMAHVRSKEPLNPGVCIEAIEEKGYMALPATV